MNVLDSLQVLCPKATGVSPSYGVYSEEDWNRLRWVSEFR